MVASFTKYFPAIRGPKTWTISVKPLGPLQDVGGVLARVAGSVTASF
jgi:hypothetical protein